MPFEKGSKKLRNCKPPDSPSLNRISIEPFEVSSLGSEALLRLYRETISCRDARTSATALANENAISLAATTANRWFKKRKLDPTVIDYLYFGITIAQHHIFYSHTWAVRPDRGGEKRNTGSHDPSSLHDLSHGDQSGRPKH